MIVHMTIGHTGLTLPLPHSETSHAASVENIPHPSAWSERAPCPGHHQSPALPLLSHHTRVSGLWTFAQTVASNGLPFPVVCSTRSYSDSYVVQESALSGSHQQCRGGQGPPLSSKSHLCCLRNSAQTGLRARRRRERPGRKWVPDVDFTLIRLGRWEQSLGHEEHMGLARSSLSSPTSQAPHGR